MKHIGFQKVHKFNTAIQVSTNIATTAATATSWATSTNTTSAVTTSTTATSNWTTVWLTSTNTTTTWQTSSTVVFNTTSNWSTDFNTSSTWSTSSTIQTLKSTSSSFNTTHSGTTTWVTSVPMSQSTSYYASTSYYQSTGYYANTTKSHTTSWTAAVSTTYSYSRSTSSSWTTYYSAGTYRTTCTYPGSGGGGFYCLPTGTLISINTTTQRPIEELQIGDTILSKGGGFNTDDHMGMHNYDVANMTGQLRETSITAHFEATSNDNINFNDGLLVATRLHYHLMKIDSRWAIRPIYVAQMYIENSLPVYFYNIDGTETEITTAVSETNSIQVWEIDTEPDDVYFANGLLTHNHKRD